MADNPLLKALPPATDHLTYLTIVEFNLTRDQLPTLHQVLQDPELASNIGWDLVHLLLPLLPAAEQCLQDVARLGNPREVVLKVTELLRAFDFESGIACFSKQRDGDATSAVCQFNNLVSMLSTLHSRIKTKYPSRFLSTSRSAVLRAYAQVAWSQDATTAVLQLIQTPSGQNKPDLPPRANSKGIHTVASQPSVPGPEAQPDVPTGKEKKLQQRLLQSFVTQVLQYYMVWMPFVKDVTGLAWTSRLQEKAHPEKMIPGRKTQAELFAENEELHARVATIGQILVSMPLSSVYHPLTLQALARDLELDSRELLRTISKADLDSESVKDEDNFPSSASDIPLSHAGALYLLVARIASVKLFKSIAVIPEISIFPDHALVVRNYLGRDGMASIGTEPEATIDAVLCLGFMAYDGQHVGQPQNDEDFNEYLQRLSLLSANTRSPTLRYQAHILTSSVLHSHPSDLVRLTYIKDTLEHCPYENLKTCAVGWLKDEVLAANKHREERPEKFSVFATPVAIDNVAPYVFPDLSQTVQRPFTAESWIALRLNFTFCLASLNFYYLLLSSSHIREALDIANLHKKHDVSRRFLAPLQEVSTADSDAPKSDDAAGGYMHREFPEDLADMWILVDALARVSGVLKDLGLD